METLGDDEIERALEDVDWARSGRTIEKRVQCDDFADALGFVNAVGEIAEDHNHHPDICIRNYNQVHLSVLTHDAGGLTERDFELARAVDDLEV